MALAQNCVIHVAAFQRTIFKLSYCHRVKQVKWFMGGNFCRRERFVSTSSASKMEAWLIHQYGGNNELALYDKVRTPTIKSPNELLIKVYAASVNPIDVKMRSKYPSVTHL